MFRIKICGVTKVSDARMVIDAGADAIGLNFYGPSPRSVSIEQAASIRAAISKAYCVGVFVNETTDNILATIESVGLSAVQLHGDEPAEQLVELASVPVIRARRMDDRGVKPLAIDLQACIDAGTKPAAMLVDAAVPGEFGGTGHTADWPALAGDREWMQGVPLVLAGGLRPDNVAQAMQQVAPHAVDTASGVESQPGIKDPDKVRAFVTAVKQKSSF